MFDHKVKRPWRSTYEWRQQKQISRWQWSHLNLFPKSKLKFPMRTDSGSGHLCECWRCRFLNRSCHCRSISSSPIQWPRPMWCRSHLLYLDSIQDLRWSSISAFLKQRIDSEFHSQFKYIWSKIFSSKKYVVFELKLAC